MCPSKLGPPDRDAVLSALFDRHPDAWVVAIGSYGQFLPMPETVRLTDQRVLGGPAAGIDLVAPADRPEVIETWERAVAEGVSNCRVRLYRDAGRWVTLHIVDATHRHGVYIGVMVGFPTGEEPSGIEHAKLVPRTSVIRKDNNAILIEVDEAATAILGWSKEDLLGRRSLDFIHPDDHDRAIASWIAMLSRPGSSRRVRLRHRHRDGTWLWLEVTNHNYAMSTDDPHVLAELVDVNDEVTAQDALRANEHLLRRLTSALPVGVVYISDDGHIDYANERLGSILGATDAVTAEEQFVNAVAPDRKRLRDAVSAVLHNGRDVDLNAVFAPAPSTRVYCDVSLRALTHDGQIAGAIACVSDVTEDMQLREELRRRATYDQLIGCLNRASIMAALAMRLEAGPRPGADAEATMVAFVDLDDFKTINDQYGHPAGDAVLQDVADRLRTAVHDDDLVGRMGGDEFLVVMRIRDDAPSLAGATRTVAGALGHPVAWEGQLLKPAASIGVACAHPTSTVGADALVRSADAAMYARKRSGADAAGPETSAPDVE
jgi:diguanylate cyclase (GGDEF)-like protein/PAS domain S-box-containing protein